jgi:crotonobetainyl-CoA:carnitine CoA-transferase CaiB-like acyl-CoA transferase
VVLESPAYGSSGPLAERAGFDMIMQAFSGLEHAAGGKGNAPLWNRLAPVDTCAAMLGTVAVLCGLIHKTRTGEGVTMESPLVNAGVWLLSELIQKPDGKFAGGEPVNESRTGHRVCEAMYQTRDGWIAIAVRGEKASQGVSSVLQMGILPRDPLTWGERDAERIGKAFAKRSTADLVSALEKVGVWVEICRPDQTAATLNNSEFQRLGIVRTSMHPIFGRILEPGVNVRFSRSEGGSTRAVDLLGGSTREVLAELGHTAAEIDDLIARKVVGVAAS